MRAIRGLAGLAATVMIAGGASLVTAPAASAASDSIDCSTSSTPLTYVVSPGETLTLSLSNCNSASVPFPGVVAQSVVMTLGGSPEAFCSLDVPLGCYTDVTDLAVTSAEIVAPMTVGALGTVATVGGIDIHMTVVVASAPAAADAPPIPAWVQSYGRDKDATCLDGWDASWESWAEPVTGGWVCTRSIPSLG